MENLKKILVSPFLLLLWIIALSVSWFLLFSFDAGTGLRTLFAILSGYGSAGLAIYCIMFSKTLAEQISKIFNKNTWKTVCMYIYEANDYMDNMEPYYRTPCLWCIMVISLGLFGAGWTFLFSFPLMIIRLLHHLNLWEKWHNILEYPDDSTDEIKPKI